MKYDVSTNNLCPHIFRSSALDLFDELYAIEVGYNRTPQGSKWMLKRNIYIIHYITAGKGKFMNKNFIAGDAYIVIPNELEMIEAESSYESYWLMFKGTKANSVVKSCELPLHNDVFKFTKTKECAMLLKQFLDASPANEIEEAYLMQGVLHNIFALHMHNCSKNIHPSFTLSSQIKNFIDSNYFNNINFSNLAQHLNYSRSHLYKVFKADYGISPTEYLLNLRIEKSKELLRQFPVNETAYSIGFNNPLYFSRIFHKRVGLSPTEYKKSTHSQKH